MSQELISSKIKDLIELAQQEDDKNTQIVMFALQGARSAKDDGLLAVAVQEFIKAVLLPKAQRSHNESLGRFN